MAGSEHAYMGLCVKYALGKSSCVSKIPPVLQKIRGITVSVFLSTLQLTALLLKKFRLRLHCYTPQVHGVGHIGLVLVPVPPPVFCFWFGIHKLARQLHRERTQMEV